LHTSLVALGSLALLTLLSACGPRVSTEAPLVFEDDDAAKPRSALPTQQIEILRTRNGVVSRHKLDAELAKGVGNFLTSLQVEAVTEGGRFVAWQILRFDNHWIDLVPGDRVSSVNGHRLETPNLVQTLWTSLAKAQSIHVSASRDGTPFELRFTIAGKIDDSRD